MPLLALTVLGAGVAQALGILTRARGRPQGVLWAKLAAAAFMVAAGLPLVRVHGLTGALVGLAGTSAVEALVLAALAGRPAVGAR